MAIRIQKYQEQIGYETTNLPEVPHIQAVEGAFGGDVARGTQAIGRGIGDVAQVLQKHAVEQRQLQNDAFVADRELKDSLFVSDMLKSTENESVVINGQKLDIPKGYLNRVGNNAEGSLGDFINKYDSYAKNVLDNIKDPTTRQRVAKNLDREYKSAYDQIQGHEAKQWRDGKIASLKANLDLKIGSSYGILDPKLLNERINEVALEQDGINRASGVDNATAQVNFRNSVKSSVEKSLMSGIKADPTGELSSNLLDSVKDKLFPEDYDDLNKTIKTSSTKLLSESKEALRRSQIANEASIVDSFVRGEKDISDVSDIGRMVASKEVRPEFGAAMIKAINKPIEEIDIEDEDQAFIDLANGIFSSSDAQGINDSLIDVLNGFSSGNLSQKNMTLLIQTAKNFGGDKKAKIELNKILNKSVMASLSAGQMTKDFIQELNKGKKPEEAALNALSTNGIVEDENKPEDNGPSLFGPSNKVPPTPSASGLRLNDLVKKSGVPDFGKGIAYAVASSPQTLAGFYKEYGEAPEENPGFWNEVLSYATGDKFVNMFPGYKESKKRTKEAVIVPMAEKMIKNNREWIAQQGITRPEADGLNKVMFDLGAGSVSIATSVGLALITKNPIASASLFGAIQKSKIYVEGREKGLSPKEMTLNSNIAAAVEGGLEMVGLSIFLRNFGGRLVNAGIRVVDNALQETLQSAGEDVVAKWRNKSGSQIVKDAVYQGALGALLGAGASVVFDASIEKTFTKKLTEAGMSEDEASAVVSETANALTEETKAIVGEVEQELEATTPFGKKLQKQMRDRENIPLYPAEDVKAGLEGVENSKRIGKEESDRIINKFVNNKPLTESEYSKLKQVLRQTPFELNKKPIVQLEGQEQIPEIQITDSTEPPIEIMPKASENVKPEDMNDPSNPLNYKTAEEYVASKGVSVFHGSGTKFDSFDDSMRGSVTGAKSAKGAIWFTDNPKVAKAYSIYAAETGPVKALLDKADAQEKIAQKSGKKSDWDKHDDLLRQAEELDTYDKATARRELADVKEAVLNKELNMLEVNAEGKTPQELSDEGDIDSWLNEQIKNAKKQGKDGLIIRNLDDAVGLYDVPSTHYAIFDSSKIKTKSQLTAEWEAAQKAKGSLSNERGSVVNAEPDVVKVSRNQLPVGKGQEKASGLEARVKQRLDSAENLVDKPSTYNQMNKKEQIRAASEYVSESPDDAMAVLKGEKLAPEGLLHSSIALALEESAASSNDAGLILKLASLRATRAGQEISMLTEQDTNSPLRYVDELQKRKIESLGDSESLKKIIKKEIKAIKKNIKKPTKGDWTSFIESIKC